MHNRQESHPILNFFKLLLDKHSWLVRILLLPELYSFLLASIQVILLTEHYLVLAASSPARANHLWKIIGYHMTGGAAFGVLKGASYSDLTLFDNIFANSLITATIILLFNTFFSLSCRGIFRIRFLESSLASMTNTANAQKKTWLKFGIPGIFAFVFLPTTGTGPIIGSIIARLIGLKFWTTIVTVISASLTSIVSVALAADKMENFLGDKTLSRITYFLILGILLVAAISHLKHRLSRKSNDSHAN